MLGGAVFGGANKPTEPWEQSRLPADKILEVPEWPEAFPLSARHLKRIDESPDTKFYAEPRLVHHIDEYARTSLGKLYAELLPKGGVVLDLMSSWTSHLSEGSGQDLSLIHI